MTEGVLYSLFGNSKNLWEEFEVSLNSLRKNNPGIKVCLVTNNKIFPKSFKNKIETVIQLNDQLHFFKLKVLAFQHSPFQKTVFLDLDTKINGDITELFEFLRYYDIAVAPDPLCNWDKEDYFVDYFNLQNLNTGVLAYQKNKTTEAFFEKWIKSFIDQDDSFFLSVPGKSDDQDFFNQAIVDERTSNQFGLKLLILPNTIYNARFWIWKKLKEDNIRNRVKVFHAHHLPKTQLAAISKKVQFRLKKLFQAKHLSAIFIL